MRPYPIAPQLAWQRKCYMGQYVLITETVTNVCCASSARDSMMLNFKTIMVSDGNSAVSQLANGDSVMPWCRSDHSFVHVYTAWQR